MIEKEISISYNRHCFFSSFSGIINIGLLYFCHFNPVIWIDAGWIELLRFGQIFLKDLTTGPFIHQRGSQGGPDPISVVPTSNTALSVKWDVCLKKNIVKSCRI